jgi:adenosine deaminase
VLEVCPTSNVALSAYRGYPEHPFPLLREAGVRVTLGSDDPPYWQATIGGEYAVARREWGLDDAALRALTRTAIEAAFVPEGLRTALLARIQQ